MKKLILITALLVCSCADRKPVSPTQAPAQYYTHVISSQGETLASIAKWYTGSSNNWQTILSSNPGLDVKRMRIGTTVQIPNNMLIRTAAMPKSKAPVVAKQDDVEILQPAQDSLANNQPVVENTEIINPEVPSADSVPSDIANNTVEETPEIKQLSPEEIAALQANSVPESTNTEPGKKSFLSKFQEAALAAQEKSLNGNTNAAPPTAPVTADTQEKMNAAMKANQDAVNQAKEAQDKALQDAAQAQKDAAAAQQNSAKTRDDLIKELTQDY